MSATTTSATNEYAIQTQGLTRSFGRGRAARPVVNEVAMNVPVGDVYGLVGPNGAGKSTLLKLVAGLLERDAGSVAVLGCALAPCETHPQLGALIEQPALYSNLSPAENLMNRALVLGLPDPKAAVAKALEAVGLNAPEVAGNTDWRWFWPRGSYTANLSLGQKQRLGVALALIGDPQVLLLDEPFNGIDPATTRQLRELIVRLAHERGTTVVVSSHTISHLERICTRFGIMRGGRLVREATAEELREAHATCVVAEVTEPERAVAVLAEELPGLAVTALPDGRLRVQAPGGGVPDREVFSRTLMDTGIVITELQVVEPDLESELVNLMQGAPSALSAPSERSQR